MGHYRQLQLQRVAEAQAAKSYDSTRHKCFISYHAADTDEVEQFLADFGTEFIAKTVGVTDEDDFIDSNDTGYVMDKIRTKYLGDSTVTIVLVGKCTWSRRYVDWEVYSSLRASKHSSINGLLAIELPSVAQNSAALPARVNDNIKRDSDNSNVGYARYHVYPAGKATMRNLVNDAFAARTSRSSTRDNTRARKVNNSPCS